MQTFSPTKIASLELVTEPVLRKKTLGGASPSIQAGEPHSPLINMLNFISLLFIYFFFLRVPIFSSPFRSN